MKNIMEIIAYMEAKLEESKNNNTNIINNYNIVIEKAKTAEESIMKAKSEAKAKAKAKYNEEIAKIEAEAKEQIFTVVINKLGITEINIVWNVKLDIDINLIGDCSSSEYCVVGGVKND